MASGTHVWSERWDRPIEDVFAVQAEVADQVAGKFGGYTGTMLAADRASAARKRPSDLTAYDLYLLAIEDKQRETRESITAAIDLLNRSLQIDPNFPVPGAAEELQIQLSGSETLAFDDFYL